jgi:hypothetical protein
MTSNELAMTTGGVVAVAAWIAASVAAWLLVTAPTTVAMAVTGQDVDSFARIAWRVIYEAVAHIIRYL